VFRQPSRFLFTACKWVVEKSWTWLKRLITHPFTAIVSFFTAGLFVVKLFDWAFGLMVAGSPLPEHPQLKILAVVGYSILFEFIWWFAHPLGLVILGLTTFNLCYKFRGYFVIRYKNARSRAQGIVAAGIYGFIMAIWDGFGDVGADLLDPIKTRITRHIRNAALVRAEKGRRIKKQPQFDPKKFPKLPKLGSRKVQTKYWIEEHRADRAGLHYDVTIQMPDKRYYRLATKPTERRKGKLGIFPGPSEKAQWVLQPEHYKPTNPPVITEGYGKGTTRVVMQGQALVWGGDSGMVHFQLEGVDGRYVLIQPQEQGNKQILMRLPERPVPNMPKPHMKSVKLGSPQAEALFKDPNTIMTLKKDGARANIRIVPDPKNPKRGRVSIGSYRPDKKMKKKYGVDIQIDYTDKLGWTEKSVPPLDLVGSGEIWVPNDPDLAKVNECLQPDPVKAAAASKRYHPRFYIHDVQTWNGQDYSGSPYSEKLDAMKEIKKQSKGTIRLPKDAHTEKGKRSLQKKAWKEVGVDGLVVDGTTKIKIREDKTFVVVGVSPEMSKTGQEKNTAIPVIRVNGVERRVAGKLSQEVKRDMKLHPEKYIGREIDVSSTRETQHGTPFQPVFERWRE